jgi:hypothetical protein
LVKINLVDLENFNKKLSTKDYERIDDKEHFLDFLKRFNFYKEIQALHSRSRAVCNMIDIRNDEEPTDGIFSKASGNWMAPVDLIRGYYGDEVAVYFEFMNFFLVWMIVPGVLGLSANLLNRL